MKFSLPMTLALGVAGVCLCGVSVYYTVDLLRTLGVDDSERTLMTVTAIGFEACKFAFVPIGLALYAHKKHGRATALLALGAALLAVSMVASLGFLAAKTDQGIETARLKSDEYKAYQIRLVTLDKSIAMLSSAAEIDANSQWRKARENAAARVAEIGALEQERSRTLAAMKSIDATASTETGALFTALGNGWNMPSDQVKKLCYIIVAALLELCSLAALSLAGIAAIKVADPSSPSGKQKWSLPRFSLWSRFSRSTASGRSASVEATGASMEALESESASQQERVRPEAFTTSRISESTLSEAVQGDAVREVGATVYDFKKFTAERKRVERDAEAARAAKVKALKAHSTMTKEAKLLAEQTKQLREEVAEHSQRLKDDNATASKALSKKSRKRAKALPTKVKRTFDQRLYALIKHEIESGQVKDSIRAIQKARGLGFSKAKMYYLQLVEDGIVLGRQFNAATSSQYSIS